MHVDDGLYIDRAVKEPLQLPLELTLTVRSLYLSPDADDPAGLVAQQRDAHGNFDPDGHPACSDGLEPATSATLTHPLDDMISPSVRVPTTERRADRSSPEAS